MSKSSTIAAALVAVMAVSIAGSLLAVRAARSPAAPTTVEPLDSRTIERVTIEQSGLPPTRLVRTSPAEWAVELDGDRWPLDPGMVRTAVRTLATLAPESADAESGPLDEPLRVTLSTGSGDRRIELDGRPMGGWARARIDGRYAGVVPGAVVDMLTRPGPGAWRVLSMAERVARDADALRLEGPGGALAFERTEGRWRMTEPVETRADGAAVAALLDAVAGTRVRRFLDGAGAPDGAMDKAVWTITLTHERPAPDGASTEPAAQRIVIGQAADAAGETAYASPGEGRPDVVVDMAALGAVSVDPVRFIARPATAVGPTEVGMIIVASAEGAQRGYRRGLDGWDALQADGSLQPADEQAVLALLEFLSARVPRTLTIGESADGAAPLAEVMLLGFREEPLDTIAVSVAPDGAPVVVREGVTRRYDGASAPALLTP